MSDMRDMQHKAALWDARREIDALRVERDRLRAALEAIARYRAEHWEGRHLAVKAQAALDTTEPAA